MLWNLKSSEGFFRKPKLACQLALASTAFLALPTVSYAVTPVNEQPRCQLPDKPWQKFERRSASELGFDWVKLRQAMASNWRASFAQHTMVIRHGCLASRRLQLSSVWRPYEGYSVSKSIASMGLGLALAEGDLSWGDPVGSLERRVDAERGSINLGHLANATAGLKRGFLEDFGFTRAFLETGWFFGNDLALTNISRPLIHKPGTYWQYSQGNIGLASSMLKTATGEGLKPYLDKRVMSKLGIPSWGWVWWKDGADTEFGFAGVTMPTPLMARIAQMVMQDGEYNGQQVLPKRYMREIKSDKNLNPIYSRMVWNNRGVDGELVAGPFAKNLVKGRLIPTAPDDMLMFLGGSSNAVVIIPSLDMVIVHNQSLSYNNPGINASLKLINQIIHSIKDDSIEHLRPYKELPNVVQLEPDGSLELDTENALKDAFSGKSNPPPIPAAAPHPRALAIMSVKQSATGGLLVNVKCPAVGGTGACEGAVTIDSVSQAYSLTAGDTSSVELAGASAADGDDVTVVTTNTTGDENVLGDAATTTNSLVLRVGES